MAKAKKKTQRKTKHCAPAARVTCNVQAAKGKITLFCGKGMKPILLKAKGHTLVPVRGGRKGKGSKRKSGKVTIIPVAAGSESMPFAS